VQFAWIVVCGLAGGCGRIAFDATSDAAVPVDAPSVFGELTGGGSGHALAAAPGGDIVIAGWYTMPVDFGTGMLLTFGGGQDTFVGMFSRDGVPRWVRGFGSPNVDRARDVAVDANGNVYVAGVTTDTIDFGDGASLQILGASDAFVASFTPEGEYRWSQRIGSAVMATEGAHSVAAGVDDTVFASGLSKGTATAGGGSPFTCSASEQMMWIAAFTTAGDTRWSTCYGTGAYNSARAVAVGRDGNLYITGYYSGTTDLGGGPLPVSSGQDVFVASFSAEGVHRWSRGFGGPDLDWGMRLVVDANDNVATVGFFTGTIDPGSGPLTANGPTDVYVATYDRDGNPRWARSFGGSECDTGLGIAVDAGGDVYVTGEFAGTANFGGGPLTADAAGDGFIARYTTAGAFVEARTIATSGTDQVTDAVMTPGGLVATGRRGANQSLCPNQPDSPEGDVFLERY
jgi:hypothetical protein